MEFFVKPYPHQMEILELSRKKPHLALLWEMGTGKTGAVINIIRDKIAQNKGNFLRTLVFTPQVTMHNWKDEIAKFSEIPEDIIYVLTGTGKKRLQLLDRAITDNGIIITNWEALINEKLYEKLIQWEPQIIVGDEIHLIKNHKAKRSKKAVDIADRVRNNNGNVFALTGTAILNSVEDIFMQYRFLDGGRLFGHNFWVFQKYYMQDKNSAWSHQQNHFPCWEPRPEAFEQLHSKIYEIATRVTKADAMPFLPPLIKIKREILLSPEQTKLYKEMKKDFITFIETDERPKAVVANLAVTKALRLLQITTGFVTDEEGNNYEIEKNPRLDATKDLLAELTPQHKVIVWCSFKKNYEQVARVCDKLDIKHVFLTGAQSAKEKKESVSAFQKDPTVRVIIANRRAGGIGVNLTAASYSIVYSRNFSLGEEKQSEARNHRGGSEIHKEIIKIDLVTPKTIDSFALSAINSKQKISDAVMAWGGNDEL